MSSRGATLAPPNAGRGVSVAAHYSSCVGRHWNCLWALVIGDPSSAKEIRPEGGTFARDIVRRIRPVRRRDATDGEPGSVRAMACVPVRIAHVEPTLAYRVLQAGRIDSRRRIAYGRGRTPRGRCCGRAVQRGSSSQGCYPLWRPRPFNVRSQLRATALSMDVP
jgi:hypothetical protein